MKFLAACLIALALCIQSVFAASPQMQKTVDEYLLLGSKAAIKKSFTLNEIIKPNVTCEPQKSSCVAAVCNYIDCKYQFQLDEVVKMCRGVDGACVDSICKNTGDCKYEFQLKDVTEMCRGTNGECVDVGCSVIGCKYSFQAKDVAQACMGVQDGGCIRYTCEKLGCKYEFQFKDAIKSCAGQL